MESRAEILVVGDLHRLWDAHDVDFVEGGAQDLLLFVGDLGDEDVELVRAIASIRAPKGVILGNHDAWASFSNKHPTERLRASVEALGDDHLGYEVLDVDAAKISIVGGRPFSWGGKDIRSPEVYDHFFGVRSIEDSADAIVEAASRARYQDLLILAHNGPFGLSRKPTAIYGKDFGKRPGGDWGDRDLAMALDRIQDTHRVRAVIAGHMHHKLHRQVGGLRNRFVERHGIYYLNPAIVPRIRENGDGRKLRHYLRTVWCDGALELSEEIWVDAHGEVRERLTPRFMELS